MFNFSKLLFILYARWYFTFVCLIYKSGSLRSLKNLISDFKLPKILNSSKNIQFQNLIFHKIHNSKISFFTKFTIPKSYFSQNSQFSKSHFSQNSHFQCLIFHKILFYKRGSLRSFKECNFTTRHLAFIYCITETNV